MTTENLDYRFTYYDTKTVLESLINEECRMATACETTSDEDEAADIGNELIAVCLLLKEFRARAKILFGPSVSNFDGRTVQIISPAV